MIRYLIDGYNFLNASGIETTEYYSPNATPLERSRMALLDFLADHLSPPEAAATTIVFDASFHSWSQTEEFSYRRMTVRFATRYPDADSLIEQLIQAHTAPKQLTVISSDHRIQRAARKRRAKFLDSDIWYRELCTRAQKRASVAAPPAKSPGVKDDIPLPDSPPQEWLKAFQIPIDDAERSIKEQDPEAISPHGITPMRSGAASQPSKDAGISGIARGALRDGDGTPLAGKHKAKTPQPIPAKPASPATVDKPPPPRLSEGSLQKWAEELGLSDQDLDLPVEAFEEKTRTRHPRRKKQT